MRYCEDARCYGAPSEAHNIRSPFPESRYVAVSPLLPQSLPLPRQSFLLWLTTALRIAVRWLRLICVAPSFSGSSPREETLGRFGTAALQCSSFYMAA